MHFVIQKYIPTMDLAYPQLQKRIPAEEKAYPYKAYLRQLIFSPPVATQTALDVTSNSYTRKIILLSYYFLHDKASNRLSRGSLEKH